MGDFCFLYASKSSEFSECLDMIWPVNKGEKIPIPSCFPFDEFNTMFVMHLRGQSATYLRRDDGGAIFELNTENRMCKGETFWS